MNDHARTVGQKAWFRCIYPLATPFVLFAVIIVLTLLFASARKFFGPNIPEGVPWQYVPRWAAITLWHLPAVFWVRALVGVVRAWRDPSFRGTRLAASAMLFLGFWVSASFIFYYDFILPIINLYPEGND